MVFIVFPFCRIGVTAEVQKKDFQTTMTCGDINMPQKAILVAVNKYKLPGSNLQGCVNDATNIRDVMLKYYGFAVKDIRVLVDDRATKKAILDRLTWLVKDARSGDRLLFHFSGHGSQIRDRDGDE
jgi:hypothetical protein